MIHTAAMSTTASSSQAIDALPAHRVLGLVQEILARRSGGRPLAPILLDVDLREAGLTSLEMVNLMLAVEAEFGVTIPDGDMTPRNFRSISAIDALVASLLGKG
jgi:acyl carrier protein